MNVTPTPVNLQPNAAVNAFAATLDPATAGRVAAVLERQRKAEETVKPSKIMIVDDEEYNVFVFRKYLRDTGYNNVVQTSDSTQAIAMIESEKPDLLLLDLMMPKVSGVDILAALASNPAYDHMPILVLTASSDAQVKQTALGLGASDFLTKPIDQHELIPRVRNALLSKTFQDRLGRYAQDLEQTIRRRTADLTASRREVVFCLARAAEFRDDNTGRHVIRVGKYVGVLARKVGFTPKDVDLLEMAAQLHDIGKIGIPDNILKKAGKLSSEEYATMKRHCAMGLHILRPMNEELSDKKAPTPPTSPLLALAGRIAATHHEKWDGSGYPLGLKGEQIPIEGRLTSIADVFDSLSSARPYKAAFPVEHCLEIIREGRGTHFDPKIVDIFFNSLEEILRLQKTLQDVQEAS
jgi:putative two-component system response regulator